LVGGRTRHAHARSQKRKIRPSRLSAGQEEGGAILTVGTGARREPNVKATMQPLFNGLESFGQNAWPSVARDVGRINDFGSRFLGAGFYYKTFFGLRGGTKDWMLFEKLIRKAAGMGVASREPDPAHYETGHASCDILVVGSGPAGLAAAKQAAEAGLDVILAEQDFAFGGDYLSQPGGASTADETVEKLAALGVTMMLRTQVFGLYDGCVAGLIESVTDQETGMQVRQRTWIVRPRQIIIATGAIERPIAFGNNDRPGIMSSSGLRTYLNRYAVCGAAFRSKARVSQILKACRLENCPNLARSASRKLSIATSQRSPEGGRRSST